MHRRLYCLLFLFLLPLLASSADAAPAPAEPTPAGPPAAHREISVGAPLPQAPENFAHALFASLTAGSVLTIIALGLALTFGLTGAINLAQGELVTIGAYTTYLVQNVFGSGLVLMPFGHALHLPGLDCSGWSYEFYFLAALPLSFCTSALVGLALERCVLRFLYGRPLESLLATWGLSHGLRQLLAAVFGTDSLPVDHPAFLSGGWSLGGANLTREQLFVFVLAALVVLGVWLLLKRTSSGLLIRSVTQDPVMASCIGVRPQRVSLWAFAFGSGLAGLAGALLTLGTAASPTLGQGYLADSCLVVIFSGVGNIVGTILGGFGLGWLQQVLDHTLGASAAATSLVMLAGLLIFFQWRPTGLFGVSPRADRTW